MNIRPHVQVIITNQGKLFCPQSHDSIKQEDFYRTVGGGIDFGETAREAIIREMKEEFDAELTNLEFVCVQENIFTSNGNPGHEIIFLFTADFKDKSMYEDKNYPILDNPTSPPAAWYPIDKFVSGERILYPSDALSYLKNQVRNPTE